MPTKYKFTYFNGRGRGETTRFIFAAAGAKYEDKRIEFAEWPELKPNTPWGSLPYLEANKDIIGDSIVICRYLAKELGLAGGNTVEAAQIDAIATNITEIREKGIGILFEKDETVKATKLKEFTDKTLTDILTKLEGHLIKNKGGNGYFIGTKLSWADLHLAVVMDQFTPLIPDALMKYPKLQDLQTRVKALPKVAAWIKERPDTPM